MESTLAEELTIIGENIRRIRKKKELSLKDLAGLVGISVPFLSQIENGKVNFNLSDLAKIGNALDVSVSSFFVGNGKKKVRLVRKEDVVWKPLIGNVTETVFCKSISNFELSMIRMPDKESSGEFNQHEGVELCFVTEGKIEAIFDGYESQTVETNDAIFYRSRIPHMWANPDNAVAEFVLINSTADL